MKKGCFILLFLLVLMFTACTRSDSRLNSPDHTADEIQVRELVEGFGAQLQTVSLLSPYAAKEIDEAYSEYVTEDLLEKWMADPSNAPGRRVSSPWPDRIDITELVRENDTAYIVQANVIEVTSMEKTGGGAAATIPVRIVVKRVNGQWLIGDYEEQS
jgi:hypothetical protein